MTYGPDDHQRQVRNAAGRGRGYSSCLRCYDTWDWKAPHTTRYDPARGYGAFPLCEECWAELGTPAARRPFYETLLLEWSRPVDSEQRRQVLAAVEAGL